MANEKRKLELDILANAKTGPGTSAAAKDIDKIATAADAAGKKMDTLNKNVNTSGKESSAAARHISSLDTEISGVNKELTRLATSFTEASDASQRLDISKSIRQTENDLRRLNKSRSILKLGIPDPSPGDADGFTSKLRGLITRSLARNPLIGAAVIGGAIFSPVIAPAIAGAVVGGAGIGGIIGGIALAAQQPAIKDYAARIGKTFSDGVTSEANVAFTAPLIRSLNAVEALSARSVPKIGAIFKNSAPGVDALTTSLVRSADALLDSAVVASSKSQPAMKSLGNMFQQVSEDAADFIDMLASHSKEGADGLDLITTALHYTTEAISFLVEGAIQGGGALTDLAGWITDGKNALEDLDPFLDLTNDGYKKGSEAAKLYRDGVIGAAGTVNDYTHYLQPAIERTSELTVAQNAAADATLGHKGALDELSTALRAEADPAFALLTAQQNLKEAQDKVAEATKKHGKNSDEAREAVRHLATAALDLEGKVGALGDAFTGELSPAMKSTLRAAGLTESQIAQVASQFRSARAAGDSFAKTYRAKIITEYINKYTNVVTSAASDAYEQTKKGLQKRAAGGPVQPGTPYMVGEHGPEIVIPNAAGRVLSAAASRGAPIGGGGGGWPAKGITARIELAGPEEIRTMFRYMIRSMNLLESAS